MLWIGTSGYSYAEWKGSFYPQKIPQAKMFAYYAEHFRTVEINNTFYKMPNEPLLRGWADAAPAGFRFALKAPQRITHFQRLKPVDDTLGVFCARARVLGDKLGPILFQLPPTFRKDLDVFASFLGRLPPDIRAAFEFRHASWHDDAVYALLRERGATMCIADSEKLTTPVVATGGFGYLRLRDEGYAPSDLRRWYEAVHAHASSWSDSFVYFKHEESGKGPELARALGEMALAGGSAVAR